MLEFFPLDGFRAGAIAINFPSDKNLKRVLELVPRFEFPNQELCKALYKETILVMSIHSSRLDKKPLGLFYKQLNELCLSFTLAAAVDAYIRVLTLRVDHSCRRDATTPEGHKL